jgi:hypothetical protein
MVKSNKEQKSKIDGVPDKSKVKSFKGSNNTKKIKKQIELEEITRRREEELERLQAENEAAEYMASIAEKIEEQLETQGTPAQVSIDDAESEFNTLNNTLSRANRKGVKEDQKDDYEWTEDDEKAVETELMRMYRSKGKSIQRSPSQVIIDRAEVSRLMRRGWSVSQVAEKMEVSIQQVEVDFGAVMRYGKRDIKENAELIRNSMLEQYAEIKKEAWEAWERSKLDMMRKTVEEEKGRLYQPKNVNEEVEETTFEVSQRAASEWGHSSPDKGSGNNKGGKKAKGSSGEAAKARAGVKYNEYGRPVDPNNGPMVTVKRVIKKTTEGRNPGSDYLKRIIECIKAERELLGLDPAKNLNLNHTLNWDALIDEASNSEQGMDKDVEAKLVKELGYTGSLLDESDPKKVKIILLSESIISESEEERIIRESIRGKKGRASTPVQPTTNDLTPDAPNPNPSLDKDYPR